MSVIAGINSILNGSAEMDSMSYVSIIQDLNRFRSGALGDTQMFDFPGQVFFRILFHFQNQSDAAATSLAANGAGIAGAEDAASCTGLLGPTWMLPGIGEAKKKDEKKDDKNSGEKKEEPTKLSREDKLNLLWNSPTAWSYFVLNNDGGRAYRVRRFVELLSNINTNSPWYFQSIKGLDEAVTRKVVGGDFNFESEPQKITIDCLEDAYDQRIGTLLDLYRSFVWSWETKREMLPSNLRKFDMTIIAFQMPIRGMHISRKALSMGTPERRGDNKTKSELTNVLMGPAGPTVVYADGTENPVASFKAFEFHGCEIDYSSTRSGWSELSNAEGSVPKYSIEIKYDDMYEIRFSEFAGIYASDLGADTGAYMFDENSESFDMSDNVDFVIIGAKSCGTIPYGESDSVPYSADIPNKSVEVIQYTDELPASTKTAKYESNSGVLDQVVGHATAWANNKLKTLYLGNLNGFSLARTGSMIEQAMSGDLFGTISNIQQATKKNWDGGNLKLGENIYKESKSRDLANTPKPMPQNDIYPDPDPVEYVGGPIGNLYGKKDSKDKPKKRTDLTTNLYGKDRVASKFERKSMSLGNLYDRTQIIKTTKE